MPLLRRSRPGSVELIMQMQRRDFFGFFLLGGLLSLLIRRLWPKDPQRPKEAMFWRRKA